MSKLTAKEIKEAAEFYERLVILKTNRHMNLTNPGYTPIARWPRESFVDYVIRVRAAFPKNHKLPRLRVKKHTLKTGWYL